MPRGTAPDIKNELRINDAVSGDTITLYYRLPTTEERVAYQKSLFTRKRNKIKSQVAETRQKWGEKILTGFKEGDFYKIENKEKSFYSSDPASPNHDPDWKNLVCTFASDLVEFMALQVFEGNSRSVEPFEDEDDEGGVGGEPEEGLGVAEETSGKN